MTWCLVYFILFFIFSLIFRELYDKTIVTKICSAINGKILLIKCIFMVCFPCHLPKGGSCLFYGHQLLYCGCFMAEASVVMKC
uniref:Secreted protein n=1 Tax=Picea sitchensis TaxID=3332 RepID=A9NZF6_PICSI|nr:unknown [Picea sitchensis]